VSTPELVHAALSGDRAAVRALCASLAPLVQARVAKALLRRRRAGVRRTVRDEVLDLTQEVFVALFERDGRLLRAWDPARGLSLANFVGLIAEREVASILRSGVRSPFTLDDALSEEALEPLQAPVGVEADVASRETLEKLLDALRARLSPLGLQMFRLLFVEERTVDEICEAMHMRPDAVYAWRSRLTRLAVQIEREFAGDVAGMSDPAYAPPIPEKEKQGAGPVEP
jgi:DNA-directed RNA polymerase specialized sigma24 family protein